MSLGNGPLSNAKNAYMNRMIGSGVKNAPRVNYVSKANIKMLYNTRHLPNNNRNILLKQVINNADKKIWNNSNNA